MAPRFVHLPSGVINKAIYNQMTRNFVKVKDKFPKEQFLKETERKVLFEHLTKLKEDLKNSHYNLQKQ